MLKDSARILFSIRLFTHVAYDRYCFVSAKTGYGKTTVDGDNMFTSVSALFLVLMLSGLVAGRLYSRDSIRVAVWKEGAFNASASTTISTPKHPKSRWEDIKSNFHLLAGNPWCRKQR
jgi:hypothetical protein